jgi:hypothetical protein
MRVSSESIVMLALLLLLAGCKTSTSVVLLGPPGVEYDPVPPEEVFVFSSEDRVLLKYRPLARLSAGMNYTTGGSYDAKVDEVLLKKAGELGAHGIIREAESEGRWGWNPTGHATAIRFVDPGRDLGAGAVHSHKDMKALVVAPLAIPEDLPMADSTVAAFTEALLDELRIAGFDPLPLDTWELAWEEAEQEAVDVVDSIDVLKGEDPFRSTEARVIRTLVNDYGADGILFPDIVGVEAGFTGDEANWDGASQKVGKTRSTGAKIFSGFLTGLIEGEYDSTEDGPPPPSGTVWALSLVVKMENAIGAHLYEGRGGIELLEGVDFEGGIFIGTPDAEAYEVEEVPLGRLFQRPGRWRRAVRLALGI